MKLTYILLALFGFSNAAVLLPVNYENLRHHVTTRDLNDLLEQFASFIPFEKCQEIVEQYVANDPDVQAAYAFLRSNEFKILTDKVVAMPQYQDFLKYLYDAGVDIYTYQNIFRKILGLPTIAPPLEMEMKTSQHESGIIKMINDILNVLPISDIKRWFYNTCLPDPDFQNLLEKLSSQEFRDLVVKIHHTQEYKELTDVLRSQGIDVDEIEKAINDFISGHFVRSVRERSLNHIVQQLISFIPLQKWKEICDQYLSTDPDVQRAYDFLRSEKFAKLLDQSERTPQHYACLQYLYELGLDVYTYQDYLRKLVGLPPIENSNTSSMDDQSGVINLVNDLLKALPVEDMKNWFFDVCMKDDDFLNFITRILTVDFTTLVNAVTDSPEYKELVQALDSNGINIEEISKALDDFVQQHTRRLRSLKTLADEFAAFIPIDGVVSIIKSYMQNDDDVKRVFAFLQGDTFRNLIVKLEDLKELKEFFNWLYSHGIDIYSLANAALGFLGMPLIIPPEGKMLEQPLRQSGFTHMINDINDILPMDDIKDWYHHVCEEDKEFKDLIKQLKSDSFSVVVKTVKEDPSFNIIHEGLINLAVDVGYLDRFLHESFGW